MSSGREDANITTGRQAWSTTPVVQMLGAGTSNSPTATEVGLSANPAAMQHGLVVQPPRQQQPEVQHSTAVKLQTPPSLQVHAAPVVQTTPVRHQQPQHQASMERSVSTAIAQHRQHMEPLLRQQQIQEQEEHQPGQHPDAGNNGPVVGQPHVVSPTAAQTPWYQTALQHARALVLGTPPDALSLGPPWTKWPDFARTNNINALILGLWPSLTEAVTQQLVLQMAPQLMADMAKTYGAGVLTGLELLEFDLGSIPPRLDGIKVYDEMGDEHLLIEMGAAWGSNIKVTVGATIQLLGYTLKLPVTVQNLQLHTRLRVAAQPLLAHYPFVGSVGVSLMEPPHVEFELPVRPLGGLDVMALPGVRGIFRLGLRLASRQFAVYPKGIAVPLVPGGAAASGPAGMLEIHLMRVSGLRSEDLIGQSDPFVILRLRQGRQLRTRTINNNNNPEFDETFKLLVDDPETQVLQLIVMDEDLVGPGKVMGVVQVPLKQSAAVSIPRTKVPMTLTLNKLMAPQQGAGGILQLPVRMAGLPLTAAATGGRMVYQNLAGALGVGRGGSGRTTGTKNLSTVLDETGWLGPSEEFLDEKGKTDWKQDGKQQQGAQTGSSTGSWAGAGITAAPAGPEVGREKDVGQPGSPAGSSSSSSFFSAFCASATGSPSASSVASTSRGSSPGRHVHATATLAVTTAAAAAAAAAAVSGGDRERRLSATELSPRNMLNSTASSSHQTDQAPTQPAVQGTWSASPAGASGMSRLNSQSAPLLHVYGGSGNEAVTTDAASDAGSSSSSSAGTTTTLSKVSLMTSAIFRRRKGGEKGVSPDDADAPPAEVVEHNRRAAELEEDQGRSALQEVQQDLAPGATARTLTGDQLKTFYRGTVFLEMTYTPFPKPTATATGAGASPAGTSSRLSAADNTAIMPHDKGILAVTLVCAHHLGGWQGEADPYATLSLVESAGAVPAGVSAAGGREQTMRSTTIYNEDNPRWNESFDFIDVRADSVLLVTIWDQATIIDAATSLKISRERFKDKVVGRVKVAVMDVANAGRIRRRWPLQGAMMGEVELILQWIHMDQVR